MSYNDREFMRRGYRVRHKYGPRRRGRIAKCVRCGVKRRKTSSGWEYLLPLQLGWPRRWGSSNPPCVPKVPA